MTIAGHRAQPIQLHLFSVKEVEVDGIAMGVLSDGAPYLTLRGLARLCGVDHAVLHRMASNWEEEKTKPRGVRIKELLASQGHSGTALNIQTSRAGETHVYTDAVCMAILEYYAFDATPPAGFFFAPWYHGRHEQRPSRRPRTDRDEMVEAL